MMIKLRALLCFLILLLVSAGAFAATDKWKGTTSGDWGTATNWSTGAVPASTDDVTIGIVAFTNQPTLNGSYSCNSITFGGLQAATLTVNSGFTLTAGSITQNFLAGTGGVSGTPVVTTFITALAGAGSIICTGAFTVGSAVKATDYSANLYDVSSQVSHLTIEGNLVMNSEGATNPGLNYPAFTVDANTVTLNGQIVTATAATPNNNYYSNNSTSVAAQEFKGIGCVATNNLYSAAGVTQNSATTFELTYDAPILTPLATNFKVIFDGQGTGTGTVLYDATSGTQTIYSDADVTVNNTVYNNLTLSGAGAKQTDAGNITVGAEGGNFTSGGGAVNFLTNNSVLTTTNNWTNTAPVTLGTNAVTIGGNLANNTGGVITGSTTNAPMGITGTLTNGGTITCNAEKVTVTGPANTSSGSVFTNGSRILTLTGAVSNGGTITGGSGAANLSGTLGNSGTFACGTGTVTITGACTNSSGGTITGSGTTATLALQSTLSNSGTITGNAEAITVGTTTATTSGSSFTGGSGIITLTGAVTNAGGITGGSGAVNLSGTLGNTGTFTCGTGTVTITGACTNSSGGTITGSGTTATLALQSTLSNSGTITGNAEAITVTGATTTSGGSTFTGGSGIVTFTGAVTNAGTITGGSGAVNLSQTLSNTGIFACGTGAVTINGNCTNNSGGNINGGSSTASLTFVDKLLNSGTIIGNAENILADSTTNNSLIITGGSGTLTLVKDCTNSGSFTCGTGTVALQKNLNNSGTFTCGADSVTITGTTTNSGTFNGGSGTDTFVAKCTNTGAINGPVGVASSMYFNSGYVGNTGSSFVGNNGYLDFSAAYTLNAGSFTAGAGEVEYHGAYTNSGAYTAGTGLAYFGKQGNQKLTDNSAGGSVFNNVLFYCKATLVTTGTGFFGVSPTGTLTMYDDGSYASTLTAGDNSTTPTTADAYLVLQSNATSSAAVAPITGNTAIKGNVNVQRYITGGAGERGYRLLSSPVYVYGTTDYSLNYPINNAYVKGSTGTAGGFDASGNPNIYLFRENLVPNGSSFISGNWRGVNKINNATAYQYSFDSESSNYYIYPGQGFLFFFRGSRKVATITTEGVTSYVPTADTLAATGILNQGSVAAAYWYTGSTSLGYTSLTTPSPGNAAVIGFNCVGNPYASTIDLNTVNTTAGAGIQITSQVETNFYELDPATQNYDVWQYSISSGIGIGTNNASRYIASGQGFFVKVDAAGQTITFNEAAKNTTAQNVAPYLFMAKKVNVPAFNPAASANAGGGPAAGPVLAGNFTGGRANSGKTPVAAAEPANGFQYLRLQLALDTINKDDILIVFDPTARSNYEPGSDAMGRAGNGPLRLSSVSTDGVDLAINRLPYPKTVQTVIPLKVGSTVNGTFTLTMKEINQVPQLYDIWLKDAYKKDSLDIRANPAYIFDVSTSDTSTFKSNRLSLVIRQNPARMVHLLIFTALKATSGDNVTWATENEANYTNFAVQRSTDGGKTFTTLDALVSSSLGAYGYLDKTPVQGANSYRLQLTDLNGTITYSNVITIMYANTGNQIALNGFMVYPNPTAGTVNLSINQPTATATATYAIQIVNNMGVVLRTAQSASPQWQGDVSALVPGTYFITVKNAADNTVVGRSAFVKL